MKAIRQFLKWLFFPPVFLLGLIVYAFTRRTPEQSHLAMIWLFCVTRGRSNDFFSWLIGRGKRPYRFPNVQGALGEVADSRMREKAGRDLREQGYHIFERKL